MPKHLNQYKGRLSSSEIAAGMNAASRNATRLAVDAQTLLDAGCTPSAAALAILSIEEAGKVTLLRWLALAETDEEISEAWRAYRSHTKKNVAWIVPKLIAEGARTLDDLAPTVDESSDHPAVLDQLKQLALYTDCLGNRQWSEPADVIEPAVAEGLVRTAQLFAKDREFTSKEIELWVKHLKPVWKREMAWMKKALENWHKEMNYQGITKDDLSDVKSFLWGKDEES